MPDSNTVHPSTGPVAGRLKDKVVLITGAGSGMGQYAAVLFAKAGAIVEVTDVNEAGLKKTVEMARSAGMEISTSIVDGVDPHAVQSWVDGIHTRRGRIDVLYNNAARVHFAPFSEMSLHQWRETLHFELDIVFLSTKAVWPHMVAGGGGSIINIASTSGMRGCELIGAAAHAAGKGGVIAFTRQLALEGAPHWIRVNSISPGPVVTPESRHFIESSKETRETFEGWPLLARTGRTADVAYAALFLASDESSFITGINLPVDGGMTAKSGFTRHS